MVDGFGVDVGEGEWITLPDDMDMTFEADVDSTWKFFTDHPLLRHPSSKPEGARGACGKDETPAIARAFVKCHDHVTRDSLRSTVERIQSPLGAFESSEVPGISLGEYVQRFYKYSNCSLSCFAIAHVYLKRIAERHFISRGNVHRLVLASLVGALKFVDDSFYKQSFYAQIGGISTEELNALEREFLGVMEYRLFVGPDTFSDALMELELCLEVEAKSEGSFESERQVIFV
mmetsp:Transcript_3035/g.10468  ORF Transcript_3035/g.10468 Transcript_3035/m.10468 type:complete len:232 (-) Transcript_3035:115-810(-)